MIVPMISRFNPTLVRLRQESGGDRLEVVALFQSHAGSIEARGEQPLNVLPCPVSIPRWFD